MPSITRLVELRYAATFSSYAAATDAPNIFEFGKRNLIYGFNGCGKTTLSRVFAFLGSGAAPAALPAGTEFEFTLDDGSSVQRDRNIEALRGRVLVYNEDFIETNFNWHEGTAEPVQLGAGQIADVKKFEELQSTITKLEETQKAALADRKKSENALATFCRDTARTVEQSARLPSRSFQAPQLIRAYSDLKIDENSILSDEAFTAAVATINQAEPPRKLATINEAPPDLEGFATGTLPKLLAETALQADLPGFLGHEAERPWLEHGYDYHRELDLKTCILCGKEFTPERYAALAAFFSDEINSIASRTKSALDFLERFEAVLDRIHSALPEVANAAPQLKAELDQRRTGALKCIERRARFVAPLRAALIKKAAAPASAVEFIDELALDRQAWLVEFASALNELATTITKQEAIVEQFGREQDAQRAAVQTHLLAQSKGTYDTLLADDKIKSDTLKAAEDELATIRKEHAGLQAKMRDHALAATPINTAIANFLRHKEIQIEPVEKGYLLKRADGSSVVKLSEGEKTAITFCYFVACLEADNRKLKDLIVVIDDPISSLDTRALNYVAALAKSSLDGAGQLFILTHNLPFMTEMRKWIAPASLLRNASDAKKKTPPEIVPIPLYQIHVRQTPDGRTRTALIDNMHSLVRDYESEYHFLYSVLHTFAAQQHPTAGPIYLLPNAIRKVLETFLSFKVPGMQNLASGLQSIKGKVSNKVDLAAVERLAETGSHGLSLAALVEPSQKAIEEAHVAANALLAMIEELDEDHAKAMRRLSNDYPALG